MDLLKNATKGYDLGGSFQVGRDESIVGLQKEVLWVKLALRLPENHIDMSFVKKKQFQLSIYI